MFDVEYTPMGLRQIRFDLLTVVAVLYYIPNSTVNFKGLGLVNVSYYFFFSLFGTTKTKNVGFCPTCLVPVYVTERTTYRMPDFLWVIKLHPCLELNKKGPLFKEMILFFLLYNKKAFV